MTKSLLQRNELLNNVECHISLKECEAMLSHDLPKELIDNNLIQTYVMVNTWVEQLAELVDVTERQQCVLALTELFKANGVTAVISYAQRYADHLIGIPTDFYENELPGDNIWCRLSCYNTCENDQQAVRRLLQIFRYPKRFTFDGGSHPELLKAYKATQETFKAIERNNRRLNESFDVESHYLYQDIKRALYELLDWDNPDVRKGWEDLYEAISTGKFGTSHNPLDYLSSGSSSMPDLMSKRGDHLTTRTVGLKLSQMEFDQLEPIYNVLGSRNLVQQPSSGKAVSCVHLVPKKTDSYRAIAMEDVRRSVYAQAIREYLTSTVSKHVDGFWSTGVVDVEDQSVSQTLVHDWIRNATIDMSGASDRIYYRLYASLFPPIIQRCIDYARCPYWVLDGKCKRTEMFATSGSPLTFIVESLIHAAIDIAAIRYQRVFSDSHESDIVCRVFGDDQIVPCESFATVCDVLESLHLVVNRNKSFSTGLFREACGCDTYAGELVSSSYWPRRELKLSVQDPESIVSLTSLQHRLYHKSTWCSTFITKVVKILEPRMTFSQPGSLYDDLWSSWITPEKGVAPHKEEGFVPTWASEREVHLALCAKRGSVDTNVSRFFGGKERDLLEHVRLAQYAHFLMHGPSYADELDRLLGVTQKPKSGSELLSTSRVTFKTIVE